MALLMLMNHPQGPNVYVFRFYILVTLYINFTKVQTFASTCMYFMTNREIPYKW